MLILVGIMFSLWEGSSEGISVNLYSKIQLARPTCSRMQEFQVILGHMVSEATEDTVPNEQTTTKHNCSYTYLCKRSIRTHRWYIVCMCVFMYRHIYWLCSLMEPRNKAPTTGIHAKCLHLGFFLWRGTTATQGEDQPQAVITTSTQWAFL